MKRALYTLCILFIATSLYGQTTTKSIVNYNKSDKFKRAVFDNDKFNGILTQQNLFKGDKAIFLNKKKAYTASQYKQRLDSIVYEEFFYDDNLWAVAEKEEFEYDVQNNVVKWTVYGRNNIDNSWIPYYMQENSYNEQNMLIQEISSEWDETYNIWLKVCRTDYDYKAGLLTTEINYCRDNIYLEWLPVDKYKYSYANGKLSQILISFWDENYNAWIEDEKIINQYNENSQILNHTVYNYISETKYWIKVWMYNYIYENNNLSQMTYVNIDYLNNASMSEWKYNYLYDINGKLVNEIYSIWGDGDWEPVWKDENLFNNNGDIVSTTGFFRDNVSAKWVFDWKQEFSHDLSYSYEELILPEILYFGDVDFETHFNHIHTGLQEYIRNQQNSQWIDSYKMILFYSSPNTDIQIVETGGLKVFPNPANEYVIFGINTEIHPANVEIFEIHGKKLLEYELKAGNKEISVQELKDGMYVYKVRYLGKIYLGKLIIK